MPSMYLVCCAWCINDNAKLARGGEEGGKLGAKMRKDDGTRVVVPRGANANNAGMKLEWASWVFVEGKEVVGAEDGGGRFGCDTCVDE